MVVGALSLFAFTQTKSIEDEIAEMEAARAVPGNENAARLYTQIIKDIESGKLDTRCPRPDYPFMKPWQTEDYPDGARLLAERSETISRLMELQRFGQCRFPIDATPEEFFRTVARISEIRAMAFLLAESAYLDIGEGRIEDAIVKCRCIHRMGDHHLQQPMLIEFAAGLALYGLSERALSWIAILSDLSGAEIDVIRQTLGSVDDQWETFAPQIARTEGLFARANFPITFRLTHPGTWLATRHSTKAFQKLYDRHLNLRRGCYILLALRQYRNQNGQWPNSLDQLQEENGEAAFDDPFDTGSLVYRLTDGSFELYFRGANTVDHSSKQTGLGGEDVMIWPVRRNTDK